MLHLPMLPPPCRRLLCVLLPILALQACAETTRYPKTQPTEVVLRFSYGDNQPMGHDWGVTSARQRTRYQTCHRALGSWRCDETLKMIYSYEQGQLNEEGEVAVSLKSAGPIGDYPTTRCIAGQGYTFMPGQWAQGPFKPQQLIQIRYQISRNDINCAHASESTPAWWPASPP